MGEHEEEKVEEKKKDVHVGLCVIGASFLTPLNQKSCKVTKLSLQGSPVSMSRQTHRRPYEKNINNRSTGTRTRLKMKYQASQ